MNKYFTVHELTDNGLTRPFKTLVDADSVGEPEAGEAAHMIHMATGEDMRNIGSCMPYAPAKIDGKPRSKGYIMTAGCTEFYLFPVSTRG